MRVLRPELVMWGGLLLLRLSSAQAHAQAPVLHEYVPAIEEGEAERELGVEGEPGSGDAEGTLEDPNEGAMVATPGDGMGAEGAGQRSPEFRPDRQTQLEGTLGYREVFEPAITPFKRVTALDATRIDRDGVTPVLVVSSTRRSRVAIEGERRPSPGRDRFEGDVVLDFSAGRVVPLPSVAPQARILSVRTEPALALVFERDRADNFFAIAPEPRPREPVRLHFVTDAPTAYFGGAIPPAPVASLAAEVPPLDPALRARALRFAAELGIGPGADLPAALAALTAHFRAFEESKLPPLDRGDIYLELARGKKGVCRHRAYAFVVTAHALGIPARFVQNEAHAWVEVKLPTLGFRRIDLGGAALGMHTRGLEGRTAYQPPEPDRLPRPAAYEHSYSIAPRAMAAGATGAGGARGRWVPSEPVAVTPSLEPMLDALRQSAPRAALSLSVEHSDVTVLRGRALRVSGRVTDAAAGTPIAGLRVEVSLSAEHRREHMLLGVTVSDSSGAFAGSFDVPAEIAVGEYRLRVVTPGDQRYQPAIAQ